MSVRKEESEGFCLLSVGVKRGPTSEKRIPARRWAKKEDIAGQRGRTGAKRFTGGSSGWAQGGSGRASGCRSEPGRDEDPGGRDGSCGVGLQNGKR